MQVFRYLFAFFFLFFVQFYHTYAQQQVIDSLNSVLNKTKIKTERISAYAYLALVYSVLHPETSLKYIDTCKLKFSKTDIQKVIPTITFALGNINLYTQKYDTALWYLEKALAITEKKDVKRYNNVLINLAVAYKYNNRYADSEKYYFEALKNANQRQTALLYSNLASLKDDMGNYDIAIEYYYKALKISEQIENKQQIVITLYNLSGLLYKNQEFDLALKHANKSFAIATEIGDSIGIADNLVKISTIIWENGQRENAISNIKDAITIYRKLGNIPLNLATANKILAIHYLDNKDYINAEEAFKEVIFELKQIGYFEQLVNAYRRFAQLNIETNRPKAALVLLDSASFYLNKITDIEEEYWVITEQANAYAQLKNFEKSTELFKNAKNLNDSVFNTKNSKIIADYNAKYDLQEKEATITKLKLDNFEKESQLKNTAFIVTFFIFAVGLLTYIYKRRSSKRFMKKIEEIRAKNFDKFHPLGNTLVAISQQINELPAEVLASKLNELGTEARRFAHLQFLPDFEKTTAHQEIEALVIEFRPYFKEKLAYLNAITDEKWKSLSTELQTLVYISVQELILNAIKHAEASLVKININIRKRKITLNYQDNGKGASDSNSTDAGKGLSRIKDLVEHLNGTVSIQTAPQYGYACDIEIPQKRFFSLF